MKTRKWFWGYSHCGFLLNSAEHLLWFNLSWQQRTTQLLSHPTPSLVGWGGESEGKGKTRGL